MEPSEIFFNERKEKAKQIFATRRALFNPYFKTDVVLNSDGFHHLQYSARRERSKREQLLKFNLLPLALEIIKKSGTIQEYRKALAPIGRKSVRDGGTPLKTVEYWGMIAIVGTKAIKVKAILRRIGDGNITFWSVMPYSKIKSGHQKLFSGDIEDE